MVLLLLLLVCIVCVELVCRNVLLQRYRGYGGSWDIEDMEVVGIYRIWR